MILPRVSKNGIIALFDAVTGRSRKSCQELRENRVSNIREQNGLAGNGICWWRNIEDLFEERECIAGLNSPLQKKPIRVTNNIFQNKIAAGIIFRISISLKNLYCIIYLYSLNFSTLVKSTNNFDIGYSEIRIKSCKLRHQYPKIFLTS